MDCFSFFVYSSKERPGDLLKCVLKIYYVTFIQEEITIDTKKVNETVSCI